MTRPSKRKLADHPGTVTRMDGRYCVDCFRLANPNYVPTGKSLPDAQVLHVIKGYQRWLAGRHERLARRQQPQLPPHVQQKRIYQ